MKKLVIVAIVGCSLFACKAFLTTTDESLIEEGTLARCRMTGRLAMYGGHIKAYNDCLVEAGIRPAAPSDSGGDVAADSAGDAGVDGDTGIADSNSETGDQ